MGYRVDCSVTPGISWKRKLGDPTRGGGTDYSEFPEEAYYVDLDDLSRPGDSAMLEIPLTTLAIRRPLFNQLYDALRDSSLAYRALRRFVLPVYEFRPTGKNLDQLLRIVALALRERRSYVELILHSSELMPAGSPTFPTAEHIEALYEDLHVLFSEVKGRFTGATLGGYYQLHELVERETPAGPSGERKGTQRPIR